MDPKRKRIYLILLVLCVLATAGILLWGRSTPAPVVVAPTSNSNAAPSAKSRSINLNATYAPPSVFPQSQTIDGSVLKSSDFTILQDFSPATLGTGELGRENPFKNY